MSKGRLEAFSDGVIAIIITIMVLELKVPQQPTWAALCERWPVFLSYVLELRLRGGLLDQPPPPAAQVRARRRHIMWLNLHLLFWLSLVPFVTAWLGEIAAGADADVQLRRRHAHRGLAYLFLQLAIAAQQTDERHGGRTAPAVEGRRRVGALCDGAAAGVDRPRVPGDALYFGIAFAWAIPDRGLAGEQR